MMFKRAMLGVAVAVALSTAHAAVPVASAPGPIDLSDGSEAIYAGSYAPATYTFGLGAGNIYQLDLSFYSLLGPVIVNSIVLSGPTSGTLTPAAGTASFTGLSAGSYSLTFNFGAGSTGLLSGSASVTATPVPEADTYALALAGLGVVGLLGVRRRTA